MFDAVKFSAFPLWFRKLTEAIRKNMEAFRERGYIRIGYALMVHEIKKYL